MLASDFYEKYIIDRQKVIIAKTTSSWSGTWNNLNANLDVWINLICTNKLCINHFQFLFKKSQTGNVEIGSEKNYVRINIYSSWLYLLNRTLKMFLAIYCPEHDSCRQVFFCHAPIPATLYKQLILNVQSNLPFMLYAFGRTSCLAIVYWYL